MVLVRFDVRQFDVSLPLTAIALEALEFLMTRLRDVVYRSQYAMLLKLSPSWREIKKRTGPDWSNNMRATLGDGELYMSLVLNVSAADSGAAD